MINKVISFKEKLISIICNLIDEEIKIQDDLPLADIGIDSLRYVELVIEIESCLNIQIDDSDLIIDNFKDINSIISLLEKYNIKLID